MTPRRSRLPKVWIWTSIGLIGSVVLGLAWWQQQLPSRLRNAVQRDELERCLQLGSQLAALRQLKPQEQALMADCLRQQAQRSWAEQRWRAALDQQRGLVLRSANPAIEERQLQAWRDQIRQRALDLFQQGQAREALNLLQLSGETRFPAGNSCIQPWPRTGQPTAMPSAGPGRPPARSSGGRPSINSTSWIIPGGRTKPHHCVNGWKAKQPLCKGPTAQKTATASRGE